MKVIQLWNDSLETHQPDGIILIRYKITGAKAGSFLNFAPQITAGYDTPGSATAALGQTTVNNLLNSTSEFVSATAFGSTAMGTDAFAFVLNLNGQAVYTDQAFVECDMNVGGTCTSYIAQAQTSALADTLAAPIRMQISSAGNVAVTFVGSGLDAATAGVLQFRLGLKLK